MIVLGDAKPRLQNSNANRVLGIIGQPQASMLY